jgi:hypothetical protein
MWTNTEKNNLLILRVSLKNLLFVHIIETNNLLNSCKRSLKVVKDASEMRIRSKIKCEREQNLLESYRIKNGTDW